jgi:hypothetical protein
MQRLNEMAQVPVKRAQVSIESLLAQLDEVIRESRADRNHSATIAGYNLIVKICAMLHEQHEHDEFGGLRSAAEIEQQMLEEFSSEEVERMCDELKASAIRSASDKAKLVERPKRRKKPKPATD